MNVNNVTRAEFDALHLQFDELRKSQAETHKMVEDMHRALMLPNPDQEKSLVRRMGEVTARVEAGDRVMNMTIRLAAFLAAVGAIAAFFRWQA